MNELKKNHLQVMDSDGHTHTEHRQPYNSIHLPNNDIYLFVPILFLMTNLSFLDLIRSSSSHYMSTYQYLLLDQTVS